MNFYVHIFLQPKFGYLILHMIATSARSQNWKEKHTIHHFKNVFQELCQISCDLYAWSGCHWMHLHIILVLSSQLLKTTKKIMQEKDTDSAKFKIHRQCFVEGNFFYKISSNCFVFANVVNFGWKKHILHCEIRFSIYSQKIYCKIVNIHHKQSLLYNT
jgi:hypothetical protein